MFDTHYTLHSLRVRNDLNVRIVGRGAMFCLSSLLFVDCHGSYQINYVKKTSISTTQNNTQILSIKTETKNKRIEPNYLLFTAPTKWYRKYRC